MAIFTTAAYVESDLIALAILIIVFVHAHNRRDSYLFGYRLFMALLGANALLLILDAILWISNGAAGQVIREVNLWLTALYYLLNPLPSYLWCLYACYLVYNEKDKIIRLALPLAIPILVNAALSVASVANGAYFYFDGNDVYFRGRLFGVMALICYSYLAGTTVFLLFRQERVQEKFFIPVLAFAIPPLIGGVLQGMFYGISIAWPCMAVSVLILYMNIQYRDLFRDHLTGLYNRRQLDCYLRERIGGGKGSRRRYTLAGIMLDLNSFKEINDVWGHDEGDQALVDAGKILSASLRKNDMVCRYGGDEFVIALELKDKQDLYRVINRIREETRRFNRGSKALYDIEFSMGYDFYEEKNGWTIQQFLRHIDQLMYQNKKRLKTEAAEPKSDICPRKKPEA